MHELDKIHPRPYGLCISIHRNKVTTVCAAQPLCSGNHYGNINIVILYHAIYASIIKLRFDSGNNLSSDRQWQ